MVTIDKGNGELVSGETLLDALARARIFMVSEPDAGCFHFVEACHYHFGVVLTKKQVLALAEELRAMASGPNANMTGLAPGKGE